MSKDLTILQVDALSEQELIAFLSDGRALILSVDQMLEACPRILPPEWGKGDSDLDVS